MLFLALFVLYAIALSVGLARAGHHGSYASGRNVGHLIWTVRVSRADVAEFMLDQLEKDSFLRTAPGVAW